jgi:hypothetical protein
VIEVKFITLCPVLKVVNCHQSSLIVSWTTKQHPPVMDAVEDDDVDVEVPDVDPPVVDGKEDEDVEPGVADVEFEKLNIAAVLKSVILRTQTNASLTSSWCRGSICTNSKSGKSSY